MSNDAMKEGGRTRYQAKGDVILKDKKSSLYQCFCEIKSRGVESPARCASVIFRGDFPAQDVQGLRTPRGSGIAPVKLVPQLGQQSLWSVDP